MKTWRLVRLPEDEKVVQTRCVFDVKTDGKGKIPRYKARLVSKGFSQIPETDFVEVFWPVTRYSAARLLLGAAGKFKWKVVLLDVMNAFVNAKVKKDIYISQPERFIKKGTWKPCLPFQQSSLWIKTITKGIR